ncbi:mechanosensitive ion channel family protein [Pseudomonas matsuisoli]|uniref:Mechanosensitive ion channel MscS domain-containing protein n=1 Tax=Pseudomonas matsuisoli TaxID=1515666 RepID=A0A917UTA2_9PSED|nr:mechanosensitive ion channel domain-containing protein [Pseudomonas matsuisoli]GGJ83448.1 hypothetical protein GCM10009304_06780 [Pseudomonas matsuisoli]
MIDYIIHGIETFPAWILSACVLGITLGVSSVLTFIHLRLMRLQSGRLNLFYATSKAGHVPVVCILWVYGAAFALYLLLPASIGWRVTLIPLAHVAVLLLSVWLLIRVAKRFVHLVDRWSEKRTSLFERFVMPFFLRCLAALAPVFLLFSLFPLFVTSQEMGDVLRSLTSLLLIASVAAVLIYGVNSTERMLSERYQFNDEDFTARKVHTQITVLRKLINFLIVVLAVASMLMVFDKVRQLGASILASAGIIGVILGFAAQKVLGNLIAGIQIALTQPIQLNDAVIVEGEWGWVEELTLTFVVIRIWDLRRLVLPITYFVENPFENWTKRDKDLLGTVILYADYHLPMEPLREEAQRLAEASPLWNGRVCVVQMLEMTEHNIQIRVLVSARGGPNAFDLRCHMREGLINFIAQRYPECLPRTRVDIPLRNGRNAPDQPLVAEGHQGPATAPSQ